MYMYCSLTFEDWIGFRQGAFTIPFILKGLTHYKNAPDRNEVRSRNGAYRESDLQARGSRVLLMQ